MQIWSVYFLKGRKYHIYWWQLCCYFWVEKRVFKEMLLYLVVTRMHSSRMRTICSSSLLLGGICLSACWDTLPGPGSGDPLEPVPGHPSPWACTWTPPPPGLGMDHPGVGLDTPRCGPGHLPTCPGSEHSHPPSQTPQPAPWVWA